MRWGSARGEQLPWEPDGIPLTEALLPALLKQQGYATHLLGLWRPLDEGRTVNPSFCTVVGCHP